MKQFLRLLFQLVLSPRHGWEDVERAGVHPSALAARGFYPLAGLAALSEFMRVLFRHRVVFMQLLMDAVITFVSLATAYFVGTFVLSVTLDSLCRPGEMDEQRAQTFALCTVGLAALITLVVNCLPVTSVALFFLPVYVVLVQWKGCDYLHIPPERQGLFMLVAVLGVLAPVYVLFYLFRLIF